MFSPDIVKSDAFLDMPVSSRDLYFYLGMDADDDGFVNPKRIMRTIGASDDDLKVLILKRFLLPFKSGVVVVKHWLIHNLIRSDLYKETFYKDEKSTLGLNENGAYTELRDGISELKQIEPPEWLRRRQESKRTVNVPKTVPRIGKDRIGKDSNLVAKSDERPFNFQEELIKLKESKRKDFKIIALYWKKKNWVFENREQFNAALTRELKAAKALKGYSGEQIAKAVGYCAKEYPEVYTLETVHKRITDMVNKKI